MQHVFVEHTSNCKMKDLQQHDNSAEQVERYRSRRVPRRAPRLLHAHRARRATRFSEPLISHTPCTTLLHLPTSLTKSPMGQPALPV